MQSSKFTISRLIQCIATPSAQLLAVILLGLTADLANCSFAMKRLYEDLFTDYNRLVLPTANNSSRVGVTLGLKLGQILDLNLKQQILSTNVWVEQTWHDNKLRWEPELYEGIDMIHVPAENIWIPDIVLFNNADGNYELTLVAKARLYSNGTVVWRPPTMFRSTCEIDVEYFPFDIQTCYLRFGSWTYAGDEVELRHVGNRTKVDIGIDLSQFYKNVEWDIIDVPAYYNDVYYDCCSEPFPDITFKIVIRRKMLFYLVNLILPVALMTFMTVSVFYLPSDSNEKVTLSISILTSLIVFFLLMLEIIPASSLAVPLFGKYLLFTLVLVSLSACVSVYVLNIHHRSPAVHSMSPRVRQIFLKTLPKLLRLNQPDPRERSSLNRFRKKKVAQQLLKASVNPNNKVYDLATPMANSLNLIETLHKSYVFNPKDDISAQNEEDEGRYFRRYVDEYIKNLKKSKQDGEPCAGLDISPRSFCCEHKRCCTRANQPLDYSLLNRGTMNVGIAPTHINLCCPSMSVSRSNSGTLRHHHQPSNCQVSRRNQYSTIDQGCSIKLAQQAEIRHDDTFDMTFDCEDQLNEGYDQRANSVLNRTLISNNSLRKSRSSSPKVKQVVDDLPSPPPPPRQVSQLTDTLRSSGQVSSCSKHLNSSDDSYSKDIHRSAMIDDEDDSHGQLVDKLIHSINLINNASDDVDTTNTTSNNDQDDDLCLLQHSHSIPVRHDSLQSNQAPSMGHISPLRFSGTTDHKSGLQRENEANLERCSGCQHEQECNRQQQWTFQGQGVAGGETHQRAHQGATLHRDALTGTTITKRPSELLLSLRLPYDQMPAHVRAAIRSILFIADTIKNEDDENSAIEDWESMSMVVDRLFLWLFFLLCTFGSIIILALAPSLYDQRASIDDRLRIDLPVSNCSASVNAQ